MRTRRDSHDPLLSHAFGQALAPWIMGDARLIADFLEYADLYPTAGPEELRRFSENKLFPTIQRLVAQATLATVVAAGALPEPQRGEVLRALWDRAIGDSEIKANLNLGVEDLRKYLARAETVRAFKRLLVLNKVDSRSDQDVQREFRAIDVEDRNRVVATLVGHVLADERLQYADIGAALTLGRLSRQDVPSVRGLPKSLPAVGLLSPGAWAVLMDYVIRGKGLAQVADAMPLRCGRAGASKGFVCNEAVRIGRFAVRRIVEHGHETPASLAWRAGRLCSQSMGGRVATRDLID